MRVHFFLRMSVIVQGPLPIPAPTGGRTGGFQGEVSLHSVLIRQKPLPQTPFPAGERLQNPLLPWGEGGKGDEGSSAASNSDAVVQDLPMRGGQVGGLNDYN